MSLFFYILYLVIIVKIYLDLIYIVNLIFDFVLLFLVSYFLKRRVKLYRVFLGSLVGSFSVVFLFLPLSNVSLIFLKIITSILMILTTFGYKNKNYFKKNFLYLYIISIILGGVLYFIITSLKYNTNALESNLSLNFIILLILAPILTYIYLRMEKNYKNTYSLIHKIEFDINNKTFIYNAYLDTGNRLCDPYKKRPILLVYDKKLIFNYEDSILVPYKTLEHEGILKCRKINHFKIDDKEVNTNVLIAISDKKFELDGIECILPNIIKEELL